VVAILLPIEALGALGQGIWKEYRTARSVDQLWNVKIAKMLGKDNILRATCLSPLKMNRRQTGDAVVFWPGSLGFIERLGVDQVSDCEELKFLIN
jgi:hypothetical protein